MPPDSHCLVVLGFFVFGGLHLLDSLPTLSFLTLALGKRLGATLAIAVPLLRPLPHPIKAHV